MNDTQIKTRHGLILQGALAQALSDARYSYAQDYQYDETCEIPDFLIPDGQRPKILIETHQTDARNSFQMKTLRAFTAVTEAKARYGSNLICINVLFGDPGRELPQSNVRAMCGFFDVNIIPRKDIAEPATIEALENTSLVLAADEDKTTEQAISEIIGSETDGIDALAALLHTRLSVARSNRSLYPLWKMERTRARSLAGPPVAGAATYYKRMMLRALFLTDEDFAELVSKGNPDNCSLSVQKQLVDTGLATIEEYIDGDHIVLEYTFATFLSNADAPRLRQLCKDVLTNFPEMHWFFEDIRSIKRRSKMVSIFLKAMDAGKDYFEQCLQECFETGNYGEIKHTRCWMADLMPLLLNLSHNYFNKVMFVHPDYSLSLGNPFNNIAIRSSRLGINEHNLAIYQDVLIKVFYEELSKLPTSQIESEAKQLSKSFLQLRLGAAIKLQKLDPLSLVAIGIASRLRLSLAPLRVKSIVGDLAQSNTVCNFVLFVFVSEARQKKIIANFVAVHDNNGDHKSKEWGARRLATLYRIVDGQVRLSEYQEAIFVIDGEWADKDVARLYRSGWNHVVRLDDLEQKLREVFDIPADEESIEIPEVELPLAAEEDDDGMEYHGG